MTTLRINLNNIAIVLVKPHIPENIGSTARAMKNMGISRLIIVEPGNFDPARVFKTATGSSAEIVENMGVKNELLDALGPFHYIVGTTARIGSNRPATTNPRALARQLVQISQHNDIAILFGPEDKGLSNEQLRLCHVTTSIPTAEFSSLNLAHAVMIFCYELFSATLQREPASVPRLANRFELEGMYAHLKSVLMKIGFIDLQNPEHWMGNIRRFLSRFPLRAREVRVIRGVCRQIDWYTEQFKQSHKRKDQE